MKIGFVGAGNMGGAILKGFAPIAEREGHAILVFTRTEETRKNLEREIPAVTACDRIEDLVMKSDLILLGMKPNQFEAVLPIVSAVYTDEKVIVSMAAGVTIRLMEDYLGETAKVVRIMPNTPAQVRESMTAVCRNDNVDDDNLSRVLYLLRAIGKAEEVEEDLMHCVIGISGSSPAYTYMYIDALIQAAVKNGMEEEKARIFAAQAVLGAAKMVVESSTSPKQLRMNVCSPGGTTIEAVETLLENGFEGDIEAGFQAAVEKSRRMSEES